MSSPRYEPFFLTSGKLFSAGRVITLPLQPGEQPSPEQQPLIRSDNPTSLLTNDTIQLIYNLAATRDRLWLLVDGGPDLPWSVRPVERFMSAHYYPIRTIETGPITRLIEYSTISAPDMFAYREPDHPTDLMFDTHIRLIGFDLPQGTTYHAGDVLALSTSWKTDAALDKNATMGCTCAMPTGMRLLRSMRSRALAFFRRVSGRPVCPYGIIALSDCRAICPPGRINCGSNSTISTRIVSVRDLPVTSGDKMDDSIGVLPVQIQVS